MSPSNDIMNFGQWVGHNLLFSEVLETDNRTPCFIFSVPNTVLKMLRMDAGGNKFGVLAPAIEFWIALIMVRGQDSIINGSVCDVLFTLHILFHHTFFTLHLKTLVIGGLFNLLVSCIIYQFIVLPQKQSNQKGRKNESMAPFIVGFGIIMPLCVVTPYYAVRYFCIKSKIIKFLTGVAQVLTFFRCSEGKRKDM